MKKLLSLLLAAVMVLSMAACGQETPAETTAAATTVSDVPDVSEAPAPSEVPAVREFTDSCGRTLTVPAEIKTIAISGPLTQVYILPLAADMLVGVSSRFADGADKYLPADVFNKTEIGQLYGGKGEMDLEALLSAAPDVVIDVGEAKKTIVEDLDGLTAQTGIPFLHIDATVATAPAAYRMLGDLLGRQEKAEELASY